MGCMPEKGGMTDIGKHELGWIIESGGCEALRGGGRDLRMCV